MTQKWKVKREDSFSSLLKFIKQSSGLSTKQSRFLIEHHHCVVNNKIETFCSYKLKEGDKISFYPRLFSALNPTVLYEDEFLIAVDKPSYIESKNLARHLNFHLVHRLDFETTGVMLLAKTLESQKKFEHLFAEKKIAKTYLAIGHDQAKTSSFFIKEKALKKPFTLNAPLWAPHPKGTMMISSFEALSSNEFSTVFKCTPITGKTHQLRYHLAKIGHPVFNDFRYSDLKQHYLCEDHFPLFLHSFETEFKHPFTGKNLKLEAELPAHFKSFIEKNNLGRID